jgi:hypothetical protein
MKNLDGARPVRSAPSHGIAMTMRAMTLSSMKVRGLRDAVRLRSTTKIVVASTRTKPLLGWRVR